jgi:hypothetical protein
VKKLALDCTFGASLLIRPDSAAIITGRNG